MCQERFPFCLPKTSMLGKSPLNIQNDAHCKYAREYLDEKNVDTECYK